MANPQYICYLPSHFILSLSPYPYPFPSHSLIISPISHSIHFHFPLFPISSYPSILFPYFPPSLHIPSILSPTPSFSLHPSYNHVQSTYTDLIPFATRFPISTHTCPCTHVVRSRIHILTFSCSPTNHTSMHIPHET